MKCIETRYNFHAFAESRIGGRSENQDTCAYQDTPLGLLIVVCDGMGGGPSGKTASSIVADAVVNTFMNAHETSIPKDVMVKAVKNASSMLLEAVRSNPALSGMGTTLTALLINDNSAVIAHIGDSRIYQLRGRRKVFRTDDHSQVFELLKSGALRDEEEARTSPSSNIITRALGPMQSPEADIVEVAYEKGDRFMLCTDGIWGSMPEKNLINIVGSTPSLSGAVDSLSIQVDELGRAAGGGHDNLTVALLETTKNSKLKQKMSTKVRYSLYTLAAICCISLLANYIQFRQASSVKAILIENTFDKKVDESTPQKELLQMVLELQQQVKENEQQAQKMDSIYSDKLKKLNDAISSGSMSETTAMKKMVEDEQHNMQLVDQINNIINNLEDLKKNEKIGDVQTTVSKIRKEFISLTDSIDARHIKNQEFSTCVTKEWISAPLMVKVDDPNHSSHISAIIAALVSLRKTVKNQ